jgi:hypothetical protein
LQVLECSEPCGNAVVEGDLILIWTAPGLKFFFVFSRFLTTSPDIPHSGGCGNLSKQINRWIDSNYAAETLTAGFSCQHQFTGLAKYLILTKSSNDT